MPLSVEGVLLTFLSQADTLQGQQCGLYPFITWCRLSPEEGETLGGPGCGEEVEARGLQVFF